MGKYIASDPIYVSFDEEALLDLLQGPEINGIWFNTLDAMRDMANEEAQTEDAEYGSAVHDEGNEWNFPPGGYIYAKNFKARVDDYYHHTLLNVLAAAPSLLEDTISGFTIAPGVTYEPRSRGAVGRSSSSGQFTSVPGVKRGTRAYKATNGKKI